MEYALSKAAIVVAVVVLAASAAFVLLSLCQAPTSLRESTIVDKLSLLTTTLDTLSREAQSAIISFSRRIDSIYTLPVQPLIIVLDIPGGGEVIINGTVKALVLKGFAPIVEGSMLRRKGTSYELLIENDTLYVVPLSSTSYQSLPLPNGSLLHKLKLHYLKFSGESFSAAEVVFKSSQLLRYQAVRIVPQNGSAILSVNGLILSNFTVSRGDLVLMEILEQIIEVAAR